MSDKNHSKNVRDMKSVHQVLNNKSLDLENIDQIDQATINEEEEIETV